MSSIRDLQTIESLKKHKIYSLTKGINYVKERGIRSTLKKLNDSDSVYYKMNDNNVISLDYDYINIIVDSVSKYLEIENSNDFLEYVKKNNIKYNLFLLSNRKNISGNYNCISYRKFLLNFTYKSYLYYGGKNNINSKLFAESIEDIIKILNDFEGLSLFANYCNKNNVGVRTGTFFTVDASKFYSGGAERYLIDLNSILSKKNITMDVYQDAEFTFFRKFGNFNVIGLPVDKPSKNNFEENLALRNVLFSYTAYPYTQLTVYSAFFESYPMALHPSIGISHGICWDNISNTWIDGLHFEIEKNNFIRSAEMCDKLVSVDTNTCNWFQTLDYKLGVEKFKYIPNYVDIDEFSPRKDYLTPRKKIVITYPRRLYAARGLYLMLDVSYKLLKKYKNIEINFVGNGFESDIKNVEKLVKKYPNNVFCYNELPDNMHKVYKKSDISVIPTIMSEGTSLSCLEAMASGNIVISTRIGGLSDLVIDRYNGYLIEVNEDALYSPLCDAIDNYQDRLIYKERAREVAKAFNKKYWIEKWSSLFDSFKLKKSEKNIDLVEIRLSKFSDINDKIISFIRDLLRNNCLVYVVLVDDADVDKMRNMSIGRIQFMNKVNEDILDKHKIYASRKILKKIKDINKYEILEDVWKKSK